MYLFFFFIVILSPASINAIIAQASFIYFSSSALPSANMQSHAWVSQRGVLVSSLILRPG
jgi:hypothetical protein